MQISEIIWRTKKELLEIKRIITKNLPSVGENVQDFPERRARKYKGIETRRKM